MASVSAVEKSLESEGDLHMAKNSTEAEAEPSAKTAANDPGMSIQVDSVGSETDVMMPATDKTEQCRQEWMGRLMATIRC